jgi:hypothetical protein
MLIYWESAFRKLVNIATESGSPKGWSSRILFTPLTWDAMDSLGVVINTGPGESGK